MKRMMILGFLVVAGCENPSLGIGTSINSSGVSVSPVFSGNVGGVGVAVAP
ncbi:MAG: hypothetical protein HKN18_16075 [Silicimonas sp.]|nr:hypothetical protein [Silicimonas sp.]